MRYFNAHTHKVDVLPSEISIVNVDLMDDNLQRYNICSVGLHPWFLKESNIDSCLTRMEEVILLGNVIAIGECGLDKTCDTDFDLQLRVFEKHVDMSENARKPLIIHCVKSVDDLIRIRKRKMALQPWIFHGFRGNELQAISLFNHGILISIGFKYNDETIKSLPLDSFFLETDDTDQDIANLYCLLAQKLGISEQELVQQMRINAERIFKINITD